MHKSGEINGGGGKGKINVMNKIKSRANRSGGTDPKFSDSHCVSFSFFMDLFFSVPSLVLSLG